MSHAQRAIFLKSKRKNNMANVVSSQKPRITNDSLQTNVLISVEGLFNTFKIMIS